MKSLDRGHFQCSDTAGRYSAPALERAIHGTGAGTMLCNDDMACVCAAPDRPVQQEPVLVEAGATADHLLARLPLD